jgi:hypothetical protein
MVDKPMVRKSEECECLFKELREQIIALDKRDSDQYRSAGKIITESNSIVLSIAKEALGLARQVKSELDSFIKEQGEGVKKITGYMETINTKLDNLETNGTSLARNISDSLSHIKVNGGTYQLGEALQHINIKQEETHKKLDEIVVLTSGLSARRKWAEATSKLIKENKLLSLMLSSRIGFFITMILLTILISTLLHPFGINLDVGSIFSWIGDKLSKLNL